MVCVRPFFFSDVRFAVFLKWSTAKEISDMYGLCLAILFQMSVLRLFEMKQSWRNLWHIWFAFGHFISDVRFAFFEMKQS